MKYSGFIDNIGFWVDVLNEDITCDKWPNNYKGWAKSLSDNELFKYCTVTQIRDTHVKIKIELSRKKDGHLINVQVAEKIFFELLKDKINEPKHYIAQIKVSYIHLTFDYFTRNKKILKRVSRHYPKGKRQNKDENTVEEITLLNLKNNIKRGA